MTWLCLVISKFPHVVAILSFKANPANPNVVITRFRIGAKAEEPRKQRIKGCRRGRRRRQETEERGRRGGSRAEERESEKQLTSTGLAIRLFDFYSIFELPHEE